ncbi:hypothetical protein VNI00_006837 [Paramarasmius palmivorus]|uniref:CNNM transmembrane domain-containing protein n=1 Tax=Paramarasmius palmivorus TaxID=297713 RepID=A0AAW0D9R8_9AGAR
MVLAFTVLTLLALTKTTFSLPLHALSHVEYHKLSRHCKIHPPEGTPIEGSSPLWFKLSLSAAFVVLGGIFSGLTLGLMGLDQLHLRVLAESSSSPRERRNAQKVLQLMKKGRHWVLVVLLLSNVIVNETLPIFLDSAIGGGLAAIVISTTAIVIFGSLMKMTFSREIIPQAVSVRYGLAIGAACSDFVLALMWIIGRGTVPIGINLPAQSFPFAAPIAWPIARLLDYILGVHETHTYRKAELKSLLQIHRTGEEPLMEEEVSILNSVLELSAKNVKSLMTPLKDVVTLSADTILDHKKLEELLSTGYSRFPVHEPGQPLAFTGLLLVKKLLCYDPAQQLPVSSFALSILPEAHPTEIISEEIVDETDQYEDNVSKRKAKRLASAGIMKGIVEHDSTSRTASKSTTTSSVGTASSTSTLVGDPWSKAKSIDAAGDSSADEHCALLSPTEAPLGTKTVSRIESWRRHTEQKYGSI